MCGIAGIHNLNRNDHISRNILLGMIGRIQHRGPDQCGLYVDDKIGLAHARLSIIDLMSGTQPIHNEDESLWIVYNGEIFNYVELRNRLKASGHRFYTTSDTEVILHLYEEKGPECLQELNGQFALAIWDVRNEELLLARDRLGIRPLFYTLINGQLIFGSEIKALFAHHQVPHIIDPIGLDQVFTFWTTLPGRTIFKDIQELPPGHYLKVVQGRVMIRKYWDIPLTTRETLWTSTLDDLCEEVKALLEDAVRIRLRADVPIGCYLSGGLDSSITTSLVAKHVQSEVRTFGIRFEEQAFDEGIYQNRMTDFLKVCHSDIVAHNERIGAIFGDILWHSEKPILRTSPAPLFLLSRLVRDSGFKVVLSGEGADEVFGGYNLFREAKVRRFWARYPDSERRARLIEYLYPYVFKETRTRSLIRAFFARGLEQNNDPLFSHLLRWCNTSRLKLFFSDDLRQAIGRYNSLEDIRERLPKTFLQVDGLLQAQFLEMRIFLSNYLLSSQGDRMAMAHSVEIRVPYLDYRLIEFMSRVPAKWKLLGLNEKYILKRCFRNELPSEIVSRPKHPYRAPIEKSFFHPARREQTMAILSVSALEEAGLFDPTKVTHLVNKLQTHGSLGEMDNMALVGILSSQIIYQQFIKTHCIRQSITIRPDLVVDRRKAQKSQQRKSLRERQVKKVKCV